nr:MAG TPA: hypothetical protein [Caudoviricetes sp.]
MSEFNVGDEVMMIVKEPHEYCPKKFPAKGSIGVVVQCTFNGELALIDWGQDSGVDWNISEDKYAWWCTAKKLEKVNANTQVNTQKEVCNMSKFRVGDKVVFINGDKHKRLSQFYPTVGSVGIIKDKDKDDGNVLVDWGEAESVHTNGNYAAKKAWWCEEEDIKLCEYTDDEVWEMLKPKMRQLVPSHIENLDMYSPIVKNMVVAAYRSGYGRATKGRSFIIKPKVDEKPSIEKSIDDVLSGKMIVTIYTDLDNNYTVSEFDHALHSEIGMEIHSNIIYDSDGVLWADGFDVIGEPDCEMYVAIPFSEAIGQFDGKSIKAMYCGDKPKIPNSIKPWSIGKYNYPMRFSNKTYAFMEFENENGKSPFFPESICSDFKALVPICDYLRVNGVNV